jgi:hypothetical protein
MVAWARIQRTDPRWQLRGEEVLGMNSFFQAGSSSIKLSREDTRLPHIRTAFVDDIRAVSCSADPPIFLKDSVLSGLRIFSI